MSQRHLENRLRTLREASGLSQGALAERVGISRQSLVAIEAGRQTPGTPVSLRLAEELGVPVEQVFQLVEAGLEARIVLPTGASAASGARRFHLGHVAGHWVAHPLDPRATQGADALALERDGAPARVQPLHPMDALRDQALVAGCAPLLGVLDDRQRRSGRSAGLRWIGASSGRAIELLAEGAVHVAGLHLAAADAPERNAAHVRARMPGRALHLVHLTRWRQGLLVAKGNPRGISGVGDLLRPDVHCARRSADAGATQLLERELASIGADLTELAPGTRARSHADVARLVQSGAVDTGVAIEAAALADDLEFLPLAEERFDLVVPTEHLQHPGVARLFDALNESAFRAEVACVPGYDLSGLGWSESIPLDAP